MLPKPDTERGRSPGERRRRAVAAEPQSARGRRPWKFPATTLKRGPAQDQRLAAVDSEVDADAALGQVAAQERSPTCRPRSVMAGSDDCPMSPPWVTDSDHVRPEPGQQLRRGGLIAPGQTRSSRGLSGPRHRRWRCLRVAWGDRRDLTVVIFDGRRWLASRPGSSARSPEAEPAPPAPGRAPGRERRPRGRLQRAEVFRQAGPITWPCCRSSRRSRSSPSRPRRRLLPPGGERAEDPPPRVGGGRSRRRSRCATTR